MQRNELIEMVTIPEAPQVGGRREINRQDTIAMK
jgi:hypothetical protein